VGGGAASPQRSLGMQEAIRCRRAYRKQLASAHCRDVEMLMPLKGFDERREKGDEPFGANPVCRIPCQEQRLLNF
jgi:hypothetical protein